VSQLRALAQRGGSPFLPEPLQGPRVEPATLSPYRRACQVTEARTPGPLQYSNAAGAVIVSIWDPVTAPGYIYSGPGQSRTLVEPSESLVTELRVFVRKTGGS
jgi:hypothetical protein